MNEQDDDKLMQAAGRLATDVAPQRDLWPDIAAAIESPQRRRWTPMLAQAAAVVLLVGASSGITWYTMQDEAPEGPQYVPTGMVFEQAAFGSHALGPGFEDARDSLVAELETELAKLSSEDRAGIETNLALIDDAIADMNEALAAEPENALLQERLLKTYQEQLSLLRRVGGLTRNVMLRNDI